MRYARALACTVLLLACSSLSGEELPPLHTGIDGTFAPHAFPSLSGGYEGFNIDLGNDIARRLHRKIIIDAAQFSGLIPALQAGTYDFLIAPTTVTKERADNMLFTEGYLNTDFQFLIKKGSPKITKLEDLKGKVVFLNFWATWCVPCREEMPAMERLYREYGERGLVVLAVNFQESPDTVKRFMRELHLTFPTVLDSDGAAARDFAVRGLPVSFLLSRDGRILWQAIGSREWDGAEARAYFKRMLLPLRP